MQFSDLYRSPKSPLARLRHQNPQPLYSQENDWDPDLFSREKGKQKAAIKRYLEKKVQTGWEFQWSRAASSRNSKQSRNAIARDEPDGTQTTAPSRNGNVTLEKLENLAQESRATPQPDQEALKSAAKQAGEGSVSPASHAIKGTTPKTAIAIADCENSAAGPQVTLDETGVSTMTDARPEGQSCGPGYEADPGSQSDYSTLSEDPAHFHSRRQWESGEETEHDEISYASSPLRVSSPYDFDNPDSVGVDIESQILVKQAKKRRELRKEMEWNEGLACFEARRDAWTGAKTVRLKPTVSSRSSVPEKPLSPLNPRRLFGWDKSTSPSPNKGNMTPHLTLQASQSSVDSGDGEGIFSVRETRSKDTNSSSNSDEGETLTPKPPLKKAGKKRYPVTTIIHKPPPLLPPENPMRASITPATYNSIFEKIVVQGMSPSCPINLGDMVRACVTGWKRRGEWPPRIAAPEPNLARRRQKERPQRQVRQPPGPSVPVGRPPPGQSMEHAQGHRHRALTTGAGMSTTLSVQIPATPAANAQKNSPPQNPPKTEGRRKSLSFLTRDKARANGGDSKDEERTGKTLRRSLQRVLGWYPHGHFRGASVDEALDAITAVGKNSVEGSKSLREKPSGEENRSGAGGGKTGPAPVVVSPEVATGRNSVELVDKEVRVAET